MSNPSDDTIISGLICKDYFNLDHLESKYQITAGLCAKLLLQLCETRCESSEINTEIDQLLMICRKKFDQPLVEVIRAIDCDEFLSLNFKINHKSSSFKIFWKFCVNLCNLDERGISILGDLFFSNAWFHNIEFQFHFIFNCIKSKLLDELLSSSLNELKTIVPKLDLLKEKKYNFTVNLELNNWKYQKVYQILMELSISNHSNQRSVLYNQILNLFVWPIKNCPDILTLGLLNLTVNPCQCKNQLLKLAILEFLNDPRPESTILHTIWEAKDESSSERWTKEIILQSMCEYYMESSACLKSSRLSRILYVAFSIKALEFVLECQIDEFTVPLACLAFKLNMMPEEMDKWILRRLNNQKEKSTISTEKETCFKTPLSLKKEKQTRTKSSSFFSRNNSMSRSSSGNDSSDTESDFSFSRYTSEKLINRHRINIDYLIEEEKDISEMLNEIQLVKYPDSNKNEVLDQICKINLSQGFPSNMNCEFSVQDYISITLNNLVADFKKSYSSSFRLNRELMLKHTSTKDHGRTEFVLLNTSTHQRFLIVEVKREGLIRQGLVQTIVAMKVMDSINGGRGKVHGFSTDGVRWRYVQLENGVFSISKALSYLTEIGDRRIEKEQWKTANSKILDFIFSILYSTFVKIKN